LTRTVVIINLHHLLTKIKIKSQLLMDLQILPIICSNIGIYVLIDNILIIVINLITKHIFPKESFNGHKCI